MNIRNAAVLITGGSRGLGRALGKALAAEGGRIVLVARSREDLEQTVDEIRRDGGEAYAIAADIADKNAIHVIAGEAAALVGPIDILIQNASVLGPLPMSLLLDTDCEDFERGLMIGITSDASVEAYPGWGSYSVSKAALDHMMRIFAAELADTGVQFLTLDPGEMDTRMHADAMPDADRSALARPETAAVQILEIIRKADRFSNGSRLGVFQKEVEQ